MNITSSTDPSGATFAGKTVFIPEGQSYKVLLTSRLMVVKGRDHGLELEVDKERITIGRSRACDLTLTDPTVSHLHAELITTESGRVLRDLRSRNGIWLAGHRVGELHLQPGTRFEIGGESIRFDPLDGQQHIPFSEKERFGRALGRSVAMREIFAVLEKAAAADVPVLLVGESGTGKELLASALHGYSLRARRPFVVFDCAAVVPELVESTLFGHEKGSYTGAEARRRGLFEEARGGTLFLDEVGELDPAVQPKLLRVLQEKTIRRLGGTKEIAVDVRIVAATNRELGRLVDEDLFREDLFYRLQVVEVRLPPLRQRREDIMPLATYFLAEGNRMRRTLGLEPVKLGERAVRVLERHDWPGNVRELRNRIERAVSLAAGPLVEPDDLFGPEIDLGALALADDIEPYKRAKSRVLAKFERRYLTRLLESCQGNLSRAAERAGLVRHHLRELCKQHGLVPARFSRR